MDYQEFMKMIENNVKSYLPEKYQSATICINEIPKNNGVVKTAISFTPSEDGLVRKIYLEGAYQEYCDNPSMENILTKAAQFIISAIEDTVVFNPEMVTNFQQAQDKIVLRVVNKDCNQEQLLSIPYHEMENTDLIATFHIDVSVGDANGSILVNHAMLESWGINENELYEKALQNTQRYHPFIVQSFDDIMGKIAFGIPATVEPNQVPAELEPNTQYRLSNEQEYNGAACLLYPDLLEKLGAAFCGNFIILPSSIHELILMEASEEVNVSELHRALLEVNVKIKPEEVLSNQVFFYDYAKSRLSMATTKEETAELLNSILVNSLLYSENEMDEDMERE